MTEYLVMWLLTDTDMYEMKSFPTEKEAWNYADVLKKEDEKYGDGDYVYGVYKRVTHNVIHKYYTYEKVEKG